MKQVALLAVMFVLVFAASATPNQTAINFLKLSR